MSDNIRVLIVDDLPETRENVRKLLQFEQDIEVIGQAGTGEEAITMAQEHLPDIILMDINMPGIDGIGASQKISELVPNAQIVIMSVQSDSDYLRRAMLAGARDFLTKPFGGDELVTAIRRVHDKRLTPRVAPVSVGAAAQVGMSVDGQTKVREGHTLAVFSPKGGSGCTSVAINLAVVLAQRGLRTILVDGSLQFGDVSFMLKMKPITSVVDVSDRINELDPDLISSVVQVHGDSGLHVLLAPRDPEMAELVRAEHIKSMLETLRTIYDFVVIDTSSALNDVVLTMLDSADRIVLVSQQDLTSLKNVIRFLNLADSLEYDAHKVWLIVNRVSNKRTLSVKDIADKSKRPVVATIPVDDAIANTAADKGEPFVVNEGRKRSIGMAVNRLADHTVQEFERIGSVETNGSDPQVPRGLIDRLLRK